jgi:hypothetical protein
MKIHFSDARIITESHGLKDSLTTLMSKAFSRMSFQLIMLDVSLKYEYDQRDGKRRKFCIIEAHLVGCEPITVTSEASCYTQAVNLAIIKLKTSYISRFGRIWNN